VLAHEILERPRPRRGLGSEEAVGGELEQLPRQVRAAGVLLGHGAIIAVPAAAVDKAGARSSVTNARARH
jgi:hypothetical protein